MDCWKLTQHVALQKRSSPKIWLWKAIITLCQSAQLSFGKNSWNSTRTITCLQHKSAISFTLNKEEFPPLLSVYSPLGSITDTTKLSACVRKSSDKTVFTISQPNIHNYVSSRKSNTRIKIPVKINRAKPTHKISKVSSKVYWGNTTIRFCAKMLLNYVLLPLAI